MAYTGDGHSLGVDVENSGSSLTSNRHDKNECDGPDDSAEEILAMQGIDPSMDKKIHLINNVSTIGRRRMTCKYIWLAN
jgi:hypothetical protein